MEDIAVIKGKGDVSDRIVKMVKTGQIWDIYLNWSWPDLLMIGFGVSRKEES